MEFLRFMPGQQVRVFMGAQWKKGKVIRPPDHRHRFVGVRIEGQASPVMVYDPRNIQPEKSDA